MKTSTFRCLHVVASIKDRSAGTSYSVPSLANALRRQGLSPDILTVRGWRHDAEAELDDVHGTSCTSYPQDFAGLPLLNRLCLSRNLYFALSHGSAPYDILHTHGLWLMPNVYPAWVARKTGAISIISTRGMLGREALQFSNLQKRAFWAFFQKSATLMAKCLHATSDQEYEEIRAFGLTNPVAIIPNGVELPEIAGDDERVCPTRTVLSLGRIHPKKGLDYLISAWAKVEADFPDWRLVVMGPDELNYTRTLKELAARLQISRITFERPVYGNAKLSALRNAELFVLPTLNDNFGLVVAEALAAGTPVISTKGAPWSGLAKEGCGWWVNVGVDPLAAALNDAMKMPRRALRRMGTKGRTWMATSFSWQRVGVDMVQVYNWLRLSGELPATVRIR